MIFENLFWDITKNKKDTDFEEYETQICRMEYISASQDLESITSYEILMTLI